MTATEKLVALLIVIVSVLIVIGLGRVIVVPAAENGPAAVEWRPGSLP